MSAELESVSASYALRDLDVNGHLRHSISFGNIEQLSGTSDSGQQAHHLSRSGMGPTEAQLDNGQTSYSCSMLFKPSPVRASGAKHRLQAACDSAETFPHLPGVSDAGLAPEEKLTASPTYASIFSRLSFLSFAPISQTTAGEPLPDKQGSAEYQPHPLTRSMSEVTLPSCSHQFSANPPDRSASMRRQDCHPLTRFDFSDSECSSPAHSSPRHIWQASNPSEDSHLSVHTCELSDSQDSPQASPTSLTSLGSFFSGLLPLLTTPDVSIRECSGSVDLHSNENSLGASQASTVSSIDSPIACLSRPQSPKPVAHRISQQACVSSPEMCTPQSSQLVPLRTTVSLSTAFDLKPPSWPLPTEVLPGSCVVDSYCMMDEEVEQSAASPEVAAPERCHVESAGPTSVLTAKIDSRMAAVHKEVLGVVCGGNTSAAVRKQVPEQLLVQLVGMMGAAAEIQTAQAEGVRAAVGPGTLCGSSTHAVGRFEQVQESVDKGSGLVFTCEKQPLRKHLHMYRTRFRIPNASIDTMQTYMLNDHIVRNSNASILSYVRLADPSLAVDGAVNMAADLDSATDSGFMYSKIKFPVIGARQYVACRRVWHRASGEGFYIVSNACQQPSLVAQAKALEDAKGLGDKAWTTDFWAGYVVRYAKLPSQSNAFGLG